MHAAEPIATPVPRNVSTLPRRPTIEVDRVARSFGSRRALIDVSLAVGAGEIHALLGPNGAGKTTLLRILGGMTRPEAGSITVLGADATKDSRAQRAVVGFVPSGDRSFYLRISGLENLVFFGRLYGFRRRDAKRRAHDVLAAVGLEEAGGVPVGEYSHGMQKRLSVARALLTEPRVLLVDEATHDLDPQAARSVRQLVHGIAQEGTAVLWATQRLDEIRDFADDATLLRAGEVCFAGSVAKLAALVRVTRYVLRLRSADGGEEPAVAALRQSLLASATVELASDEPDLFVVELRPDATLGDALAALASAGVEVVSCREARSEIEEAFVQLTGRA